MPLISAARLDQIFTEDEPRSHTPDPRDVLFARARALPREDQLLLELVYRQQLSHRQIAVLVRQPPGTVSRRLARIVARLRDPLVASLLDPDCILTPSYRLIGIEYFAQRNRIGAIAAHHDLPHSQVRSILNFIRGWHRGVQLD